MIEVFLRDWEGKAIFPLSLTLQVLPSKGDTIQYWDAGGPETGGIGMLAEVDQVWHTIYRAKGDHIVHLALKNVRTLISDGKIFPPETPSDSDEVGQSDGPRRG